MLFMLILIVVASILTFAALFPGRWVLQKCGVVDRPNLRSSHSKTTIRGGGVVIVAVLVGGFLTQRMWGDALVVGQTQNALLVGRCFVVALAVMFLVLGIVSFVDDVSGVRPVWRFTVHLVVALGTVVVAQFSVNWRESIVGMVVDVIWIIGYINAFNFMDGINGIAGGQVVFTGLGSALIAIALGIRSDAPVVVLLLLSVGSCLGFLPHNFPKARVFMGDVGSAPLGFLLAVFAVWIAMLSSWWVLFWIGLLHANFVLDTGITMVRRASWGERLSDAHREHFYQRLVRAGWSHTAVTLTEFVLQGIVMILVCWGTLETPGVRIGVAGAVIVIWLGFFAFAESTFRRSAAFQASLV